MITRFEHELRATKPTDFDGWLDELGLYTDVSGECGLLEVVMQYAPPECVRYLVSRQDVWEGLLARARYADTCRMMFGVYVGWERSR